MTSEPQDRRRASVTQLGYLGISVSNLPVWQEFAENVLGLQRTRVLADGAVQYRMDEYQHRLTLVPDGGDALLFAGWETRDGEAMAEIGDAARAAGAQVTAGTPDILAARGVLGLLTFEDPDGLPVEIFHGAHLAHTPFVSPRNVKFVAGELGLGHIVLRTADMERTVDFYQRVLGIKISDSIIRTRDGRPHVVTFAHVNERHHSIAITGGLTDDLRKSNKRLSHMMVEVSSLDEVGQTFDLAGSRGLNGNQIGRHTNDRMVSFYLETPSGFNVEYGYGGLQIVDPDKWIVRHYTSISEWGHGPMLREPPKTN